MRLTAGGTVGPAHVSAVFESDGVTALDITPYFTGNLEATYTIGADGHITAATATADGIINLITPYSGHSQIGTYVDKLLSEEGRDWLARVIDFIQGIEST